MHHLYYSSLHFKDFFLDTEVSVSTEHVLILQPVPHVLPTMQLLFVDKVITALQRWNFWLVFRGTLPRCFKHLAAFYLFFL